MALPTSIFVHTNDRAKPIALTGVTDWRYCKWRKPSGTYRNGEKWTPGTASIYASSTTRTNESTFPAVPTSDPQIVSSPATSVSPLKSDEMQAIPPRQKWEIVSGLVVAVNGAVIPEPSSVLPLTSAARGRNLITDVISGVTVDTVLNQFDTGYDYWRPGDRFQVAGSTQPGGTSASTVYEVLAVSGTAFTLKDPDTGGVLDITSAGASVSVQMIEAVDRTLPLKISLTATAATDIFTMAAADDFFITGDVIRLSAGTVPTDLAVNTEYRVRIVDNGAFQLEDPDTGVLKTFSSAGATVVGYLVRPAELDDGYEPVQLDGISGLIRFPDSLSPKISTVQ